MKLTFAIIISVLLMIMGVHVYGHIEESVPATDNGANGAGDDVWLAPLQIVPVRGLRSEFPPLSPLLMKTYDLLDVKYGNISHYGATAAVAGPPCLRGNSGDCDRAVSSCINGRHYLSVFCNCFDYYSRSYNCLIDKYCGHD